jgi:hypothetical protein
VGKTSPITRFLRELAAHELATCAGPGVGAVGMCLTGGFALAMSVDPIMIAPVLSQPSLPLGFNAAHRRALGISDEDLRVVKDRVSQGLCVMGLRFTGDTSAPAERFARLREELVAEQPVGLPQGRPLGAHRGLLGCSGLSDPSSPRRRALVPRVEARRRLNRSATGVGRRRGSSGALHRREDLGQRVLRVAKDQHRLGVVEQLVLNAGESGAHRTLQEEHVLREVRADDRHAVDR